MSFTPVPKPSRSPEKKKPWIERYRDEIRSLTPQQRQERFGKKPRKALKRTWMKRGTKPMAKVNAKRQAKRTAHYRNVLASDFHKDLRYCAFTRSGGLCECAQCKNVRDLLAKGIAAYVSADVDLATTPIPVWFVKGGGEAHRRFRSTAGELHHTSYKFFGYENPAELAHVQWVWKECHQRLEAEHGTRRAFLRGRR